MKRLAIVVSILAIGATGCGSSSTAPSPSTFKVFTVQMSPANENPPISNAESTGKGTAVITIHTDTNTIDFSISMTSFPANTNVILAHIHPGVVGQDGARGPASGLCGDALLPTNGSGTFIAGGVPAAQRRHAATRVTTSRLAAEPTSTCTNR